MISDGKWNVKSLSGLVGDGYTITRKALSCSQCTTSLHCTAAECGFLCRHMYECDDRCFDYNNGHICKHVHRVHSLSQCLPQLSATNHDETNPESSLPNTTTSHTGLRFPTNDPQSNNIFM